MAYNKHELSHVLKQDLGYDYIEIEFILEDTESPKVEEKPKQKYVLAPLVSRKEKRRDRKSRQKSSVKFIRPVSNFSVAQSRISY